LEQQEKKVIADIKKMAKQGQMVGDQIVGRVNTLLFSRTPLK
jgi:hypothetical protein